MPPRHSYWTIILEGKPTAFRTHSDAELLPTFRQLQSRHPDVVMKWFSRGRLWSCLNVGISSSRSCARNAVGFPSTMIVQ